MPRPAAACNPAPRAPRHPAPRDTLHKAVYAMSYARSLPAGRPRPARSGMGHSGSTVPSAPPCASSVVSSAAAGGASLPAARSGSPPHRWQEATRVRARRGTTARAPPRSRPHRTAPTQSRRPAAARRRVAHASDHRHAGPPRARRAALGRGRAGPRPAAGTGRIVATSRAGTRRRPPPPPPPHLHARPLRIACSACRVDRLAASRRVIQALEKRQCDGWQRGDRVPVPHPPPPPTKRGCLKIVPNRGGGGEQVCRGRHLESGARPSGDAARPTRQPARPPARPAPNA